MNTLPAGLAHALPEATARTLAAALENALAAETRRVYRSHLKTFDTWCADNDRIPIPASPETVAAYVADRSASVGVGSLKLACAAIAFAHRTADQDNPCTSAIVRTALRGFARMARRTAVRQSRPLDAEAVAAIRGSLEGRCATDRMAARDMAIVSLLACTGLRRSEAARLEWADIQSEADGTGRLTVGFSKTDQEGEGAVVAVTARAMTDLARWRTHADAESVFGLGPDQINRRVKSLAAAVGLAGITAHGGRVGLAQTMVGKGAPTVAVQRQGRWTTTRMVARYTRNQKAAEALAYL